MGRRFLEPREEAVDLGDPERLVRRDVVQVRDREDEAGAAREREQHAVGGPRCPQVHPLDVRRAQGLPDQEAVAVLRSPGPSADGLVAPLARGTQQAVLLERIDDLVQPEHVRLQRGHVREQQRQALVPPIGQVADVEGRDEQAVHGGLLGSGGGRRRGRGAAGATMGMVTVKVEPAPSSDSTVIRPPWPSTTWRAIARPSPVPPPRTRARSAL